jgi:sortase A
MTRTLRIVGSASMAAGTLVSLYLLYSLVFTGRMTIQAQESLREDWDRTVAGQSDDRELAGPGPRTEAAATAQVDPPGSPAPQPPAASGSAVAVMRFLRPRRAEPLVYREPLIVVEGVGTEELKRGPGHYPGTALPGEPGNFAVAGHRTTYGAPFFHLDQLVPKDIIELTARSGQVLSYRVTRAEVVEPSEGWAIGPDPLGTGNPTVTLTTCFPRFSDRQRLVVFAELAHR